MVNRRVITTPTAKTDLQQAVAWIAERSPAAAARWLTGLEQAIESLRQMPEQHGLAAEAADLAIPLRELVYKTKSSATRVLFILEGDEVRVLHIRRPGQDFLRVGE